MMWEWMSESDAPTNMYRPRTDRGRYCQLHLLNLTGKYDNWRDLSNSVTA